MRVQISTDPWCLVVQKSEPRMANRHAPLDLHILTTLENLESASKKIPKIYGGKSVINAADMLLTKTKFFNSW
jgi:hypothetical protein